MNTVIIAYLDRVDTHLLNEQMDLVSRLTIRTRIDHIRRLLSDVGIGKDFPAK